MTKSFLCPFKNKDICHNIPNVEYKKPWHAGGTGYIDGIRPSDDIFDTGPLAKFIDYADRSGIAIKYEVTCPEGHEQLNKEYAMAAFQRYTDSYSLWTIGNHHGLESVAQEALTSGRIRSTWLEEFISNEHATFKDYHYDEESDDYIAIECSIALSGVGHPTTIDTNTNGEL